jgi:acetyl esterase/lipase
VKTWKRIINFDLHKLILLIAIILPLCNCSRIPEEQPGMKSYIYKTIGHKKLKLYVFQPTNQQDAGDLPVVVFFHGGGFSGGKVTQFESQCHYLSHRGIVAILVEYRLINRHSITPFECVEDAKSAIRWVRAHSYELGISEDRIIAGGGSAGGHLAACTAVIKGYDNRNEDLYVSSVPNALVLFNPVVNFPESFMKTANKHHGEWQNRATEISPMHNVSKGAPPTIIFHGTADESVPFHHAELFCAEMEKYGNYCEIVPFEGRHHGFFNYHVSEEDFKATMLRTYVFLTSLGYINKETTEIK